MTREEEEIGLIEYLDSGAPTHGELTRDVT